ncbi:MAG: DUF72 domain-containing protein [Candidatus Competibacterales bacterium]
MAIAHYHLGCPLWSYRSWLGSLLISDTPASQWLGQYAQVFNTVEGNTTFYGTPNPNTVARWGDDTPPGFHFCFKFPQVISHRRRLRHASAETRDFLKVLEPLAARDRLGPTWLQLPPTFGPADLDLLDSYLQGLPRDWAFAVEVRHEAFFTKGEGERRLNRLLRGLAMERVVLDSRPLFSAPGADEDTRGAQAKKPRVPVRAIALGKHPLVRFIGHPSLAANEVFLEPWWTKLQAWLDEGRQPYFFAHTPNNHLAPQLARRVHQHLQTLRPTVGELPPWPGEVHQMPRQAQLF